MEGEGAACEGRVASHKGKQVRFSSTVRGGLSLCFCTDLDSVMGSCSRPTLSFAQRVDDAVARARANPSPLPNRITDPASLSAADAAKLEDSEEWLSLDEQGLEDILSARSSRKTPGAMLGDSDLEDSDDDDDDEDDEEEAGEGGEGMQGVEGGRSAQEKAEEKKARKAAKRLEAMAGKVQDFVEGRGAVSGALFDEYVLDLRLSASHSSHGNPHIG